MFERPVLIPAGSRIEGRVTPFDLSLWATLIGDEPLDRSLADTTTVRFALDTID